MKDRPEKTDKSNILAFVWHPPYDVITAGGFVRTYEVFKRTPDDFQLTVFENDPSILSDIKKDNVRIREYRMPKALRRLEPRLFLIERITEWILSFLYMSLASLKLKAQGARFDTIYVPAAEVIPALMAGIVAKWVFNKPLVVCNMNIEYYTPLFRKFVVMLHNRADKIITLSDDLSSVLLSNGIKTPLVINGVGLDTDSILEVTESRDIEKKHEAIFIGRHSPTKGIYDLMKIWSMVTGHYPSAELIMVGTCSPKIKSKLLSLIEEHGLGNSVVFKGTVDEETKYKLIKESKVCLFPSYLEGWGITPQEALACGLPVITYDLPVYEENIRPCGAVITVPVGKYEEMAEKTIELLSGRKYDEFKDIGPCFVQRFSWDDVAVKEFRLMMNDIGMP